MREVHFADLAQQRCQILEPLGDDVGNLALALQRAADCDHRRGQDDPAVSLRKCAASDSIGDAGLVLQGDEGDVALAGALADQDDAGDMDLVAVLEVLEARPR